MKNYFKTLTKKELLLLSILILLALPFVIQAQNPPDMIVGILGRLIGIFWNVFYGLVIIIFIIAGIMYLTARGDPSKIQSANKTLIWAIVGVAVGLLANFATAIVKSLLGT